MRLWILHNGVSVLNADGVTEPPHRPGAAPEIAKLPVAVQVDCAPNDVIVDVLLVDVGADDESVIAFGEPPRHLHAEAIRLLRCDLSRHKGLPQVIGNHIILAPYPARGCCILPLGQQELGVRSPAVTGIAGDKPAIIRLFGFFTYPMISGWRVSRFGPSRVCSGMMRVVAITFLLLKEAA